MIKGKDNKAGLEFPVVIVYNGLSIFLGCFLQEVYFIYLSALVGRCFVFCSILSALIVLLLLFFLLVFTGSVCCVAMPEV